MFKDKERGTALVEFSLVLPLLLIIIFGIIEFSILFYDKAVITNASREVAREFAIHKDTQFTYSQLKDTLENYIYGTTTPLPDSNSRLISIRENNPPDLVTIIGSSNDTPTGNPETKGISDQYVTATVTYTYEWMFLPGFMSNALPDINLSATTTMRNEDYEP